MVNIDDFAGKKFSVAFTEELHNDLEKQFDSGRYQEDLIFALYKLSEGNSRCTAILQKLIYPVEGDRILQGNVAFTSEYFIKVLGVATEGYGIAFLHSHLGPGWQGMSSDDIVAEKDRLASAVAGSTRLPLVGLTMGTDGSWSARFWLRAGANDYRRCWAETVRVVGADLKITYNPHLYEDTLDKETQIATISVWGEEKQRDIARTHVGIIGLGSVGSIVAEGLARLGVSHYTLIDHDIIENRNLDRTLGATREDVENKTPKVVIAQRTITHSHTSKKITITSCLCSLLGDDGYKNALDCDVIFSCVDRPLPRHVLNTMAYSHLIPVIDGGIVAKVDGMKLINADWRIHAISPGRPCMMCINALTMEQVALDKSGQLDNPSYIEGLPPEMKASLARQNVFPFSMSVAAHEILQFVGLVTGMKRLGGYGSQMYHCYPGFMEVLNITKCQEDCEYSKLTATAIDLSGNWN